MTTLQPKRYCGKEELTMHGYNMYDSGARFHTSRYFRFISIDPLAEKYYSISPYAYCMGNPVKYVDPDGRKVVIGTLLGRVAAFFGVDNFESQAQSQINQLKKADKDVNNMIEKMEDSKFEVKIVPTTLTGKTSKNSIRRNYKNASVKQGQLPKHEGAIKVRFKADRRVVILKTEFE